VNAAAARRLGLVIVWSGSERTDTGPPGLGRSDPGDVSSYSLFRVLEEQTEGKHMIISELLLVLLLTFAAGRTLDRLVYSSRYRPRGSRGFW
jgi:hypothetical protein